MLDNLLAGTALNPRFLQTAQEFANDIYIGTNVRDIVGATEQTTVNDLVSPRAIIFIEGGGGHLAILGCLLFRKGMRGMYYFAFNYDEASFKPTVPSPCGAGQEHNMAIAGTFKVFSQMYNKDKVNHHFCGAYMNMTSWDYQQMAVANLRPHGKPDDYYGNPNATDADNGDKAANSMLSRWPNEWETMKGGSTGLGFSYFRVGMG